MLKRKRDAANAAEAEEMKALAERLDKMARTEGTLMRPQVRI
jgi:hypothetical protein